MPDEERAHGTISMKTYYQYFKAGGGHVFTAVVLLVFIITEVVFITITVQAIEPFILPFLYSC